MKRVFDIVGWALMTFVFACIAVVGVNAGDNAPAPASTGKHSVEEAVRDLSKVVPSFSTEEREAAIKRLSRAEVVDPATLAAELAQSRNAEVADFGMELMTEICVDNPAIFDPNVFFMRYAAAGSAALPYVAEIMDLTDDDFCREWACELFCEIYRHTAPEDSAAKARFDALAKRAEGTYAEIKRLLTDSRGLKDLVKSGFSLSEPFKREWRGDARRPMKLMALFHLLDSINSSNIEASALRGLRIIDTFNYNYDILGRVGGKPVPGTKVYLPTVARLKRLTAFLKKKRGKLVYLPGIASISLEEIESAMQMGDAGEMRRILTSLKTALGAVTRGKLLAGRGRRELELARHFDYAVWNGKRIRWNDNMITVRNATSKGVGLLLSGSGGGAQLALSPASDGNHAASREFNVPAGKTFVWFLPDGGYKVELKDGGDKTMLSAKSITLHRNNAEVVLTPAR